MVQDTSLANLQPGNRKGSKNKITKAIAQKLVEYLDEDFDVFIDEIGQLTPKDRVAAKLKLYDMVLPKKQEVEVEAIETAKWQIVRASEVQKPAAEEPETSVEEVEVELAEGDPNQLLLDFSEPAATPDAPQPAAPALVVLQRASQVK